MHKKRTGGMGGVCKTVKPLYGYDHMEVFYVLRIAVKRRKGCSPLFGSAATEINQNAHTGFIPYRSAPLLSRIFSVFREKSRNSHFNFSSCCYILWMRHSFIISTTGILLVKMYAWSSYPAGSELCRNRTGLRLSVRSFGCALFYLLGKARNPI